MEAPVWCEVHHDHLVHNLKTFRHHLSTHTRLAPTVKSNAYGHGLLLAAHAFLEGGADWLCVHTLEEARLLRQADVRCPIYLFGPLFSFQIEEATLLGIHQVLYTHEHLQGLIHLSPSVVQEAFNRWGPQHWGVSPVPTTPKIPLHLKLETGNHRQGVNRQSAHTLLQVSQDCPHLQWVGFTSHFANIEDTTDPTYAQYQLQRFHRDVHLLQSEFPKSFIFPPLKHMANSAASILWPDQSMDLARIGISAYGHWPSKETQSLARYKHIHLSLRPALTWKTRLAQIKSIPQGAKIGYGCTYTTLRPSLIGVLPVGYHEGYDRKMSNLGHVLIRGHRAPIRGRICMNMMMVDLTDLPQAQSIQRGDEVILMGKQGQEEITAEALASWSQTIQYEVLARIPAHIPRVLI